MIEIKEGAVYRDGVQVGTVEGESLIVPEKLHHKVAEKIEKETGLKVLVRAPALSLETEGVTAETHDMGATLGLNPNVVYSPPSPIEVEGVTPENGEILSTSEEIEEPAPPMDHRGDKTPAFIEWLFRNRPEEAATRYANRRISRQ